MDLTDFITKSNEAKDIQDLYYLLETALLQLCGYDRVLFSLMSDHPSLGLKAGHGIMRNYPDDWMKHYVEKGYEHLDPVPQFGFRHVGPFVWDSLPLVMGINAQQTLCMNECREAGFFNGAAVCIRGVTGELGGIGVASSAQRQPDSEKETKYKLSLLNMVAHQFYVAFCSLHEARMNYADNVDLTLREIQVLKHMARAKKDDVIANDMNLTKHAVNFHIRNILKKFHASNRTSVIIKAINGGFLGIEDTAIIRKTS